MKTALRSLWKKIAATLVPGFITALVLGAWKLVWANLVLAAGRVPLDDLMRAMAGVMAAALTAIIALIWLCWLFFLRWKRSAAEAANKVWRR